MFRYLGQVLLLKVLPNGRLVKYDGTGRSRLHRCPFLEDQTTLLKLLEGGKIKPVIAKTFPILQAVLANASLESRHVIGHIVLVALELL